MTAILALPPDQGALSGLPRDIGGLCAAIQGLLIHDSAAGSMYGPPPEDFVIDRTTLPVAERLARARARHPWPLSVARPPFERQVGTCRDYAAMLTALARYAGFAARVRCGFAAYLGAVGDRDDGQDHLHDHWHDHWIVEYRGHAGADWKLADPQLDAEHRSALDIQFEIADVPRRLFVPAPEAWAQWRSGQAAADAFGHGESSGPRMLLVNLVRDVLARRDVLTSPWDRWRTLGDLSAPLDPAVSALGDRLAGGDAAALEALGARAPFAALTRAGAAQV